MLQIPKLQVSWLQEWQVLIPWCLPHSCRHTRPLTTTQPGVKTRSCFTDCPCRCVKVKKKKLMTASVKQQGGDSWWGSNSN
jgi:hypothetical protein